jgi:hypothetical protein
MPRPRPQRAATARRETAQPPIWEQSFLVDSSAHSRTDPAAAGLPAGGLRPPTPASVSDSVAADTSGLASEGSSRGFVTAPPTHPAAHLAVHTPGVQGAGVSSVRERSLVHSHFESEVDLYDFQDFTTALLTMRQSRARAFGDGNVQRNLFAHTHTEVAGDRLAHAGGNDTLRREDVNYVSNHISNSNSPASPEVAINQVALSIDRSISEAVDVSCWSRGVVIPPSYHVRRPLDSSVSGSDAIRTPVNTTPSSGYQELVRAAGVMNAARWCEMEGSTLGGAIPPMATDSHIGETSTPNSDPLNAYASVSGTGRGMAQSRGGRDVFTHGRGGSVIGGGMRFADTSPIIPFSASPSTRGFNVQWPSRTAEGRGLVPTNLFGQDESGAFAKFSVFIRQVPDWQVGQRCISLLAAFRASQKSSYSMWVNSQGVFLRV